MCASSFVSRSVQILLISFINVTYLSPELDQRVEMQRRSTGSTSWCKVQLPEISTCRPFIRPGTFGLGSVPVSELEICYSWNYINQVIVHSEFHVLTSACGATCIPLVNELPCDFPLKKTYCPPTSCSLMNLLTSATKTQL